MPSLHRRSLLATAALAAPSLLLGAKIARADSSKTFRIGYQKAAVTLALARATKKFESSFAPLGWNVSWAEFTSGPPMMEALAGNAIDFAFTGEPPVIFAQAAHTDLVYIAATQSKPGNNAILKPPGSKLSNVADLKGKRVAVTKGSSAHYLLVAALEHANVPYSSVEKVFLEPADARAAFASGAVDAWSIWDPFYAAAQIAGATLLVDGVGLTPGHSIYTAGRAFAQKNPDIMIQAIEVLNTQEQWEKNNQAEMIRLIAPSLGLPESVLKIWFARGKYGVGKMTPEIFAGQQKIADTFFELGIIPEKITVTDARWTA